MIEIDGSTGGGQLVRSALGLSAVSGRPITVTDIRTERPTPGLRPQHLAAIRLMADICSAEVSGADVDATSIVFRPGRVSGGRYTADIGTAGSVALAFDTLLPLATAETVPLAVTVTGGTDVAWSPPIDYLSWVKLPLLRRFGLHAGVDVDRRGFYPVGGGEATMYLASSSIRPIELPTSGAIASARIHSIASASLADADVASRQLDAAIDRLEDRDLSILERTRSAVDSDSPGSAIVVRVDADESMAGFDALGERGKPAEAVGREAADAAVAFLESGAAVDRHLADQLIVLVALVGGRIAIPAVTEHVESSLRLVRQFGYDVELDESGETPLVTA